MGPINSTKSAVRLMNSNKNKLNNKIILIFHFNPNIHFMSDFFINFIRYRVNEINFFSFTCYFNNIFSLLIIYTKFLLDGPTINHL